MFAFFEGSGAIGRIPGDGIGSFKTKFQLDAKLST